MLRDPLFNQDENQILNESLTFFFAGTLTQATLLSNTLSYMIMDDKINVRARESLSKNFKAFADKNATIEDLAKELNIDNFDQENDDYLKQCMYESMRIEPPVPMSTGFIMTEDQVLGGIKVRKGQLMFCDIV